MVKSFKIGFLFGAAGTLIASFGLVSRIVEILAEYFLIPGRFALAPFTETFATMPGAANIAIFMVANGIIYGAAFAVFGGFFRLFMASSQ